MKNNETIDQGWVKLHRQLFDNSIWLEEPFTYGQAWIDLFANANHKPSTFFIKRQEVSLKRGQIAWSEVHMAQRWKWSRNKVRRFLKSLKTKQQIEQHNIRYLTSIITILNYDKYQDMEQQTEQHKNSRRNINKNDKNEKNDKNIVTNVTNDYEDVNQLIDKFKGVNPSYKLLFARKPQRKAVEEMIKEHGIDKMHEIMDRLPVIVTQPYAPSITTPIELQNKMGQLILFMAKSQNERANKFATYDPNASQSTTF